MAFWATKCPNCGAKIKGIITWQVILGLIILILLVRVLVSNHNSGQTYTSSYSSTSMLASVASAEQHETVNSKQSGETIFDAATNGDVAFIKNYTGDINKKSDDELEQTALILAMMPEVKNQLQVVQALLQKMRT